MMSDAGLRMSQSGRPRQQLAVGKHHFLAGGASEAIICSCINGRASISTLLGLAGPSDASSSSGRGRRVAVAGGHSDHFSGLHDTVPSRRQASKRAKLSQEVAAASAARQDSAAAAGPSTKFPVVYRSQLSLESAPGRKSPR